MRKCLAAIILAMVASTATAMPLDLDNPNGIAAIFVVPNGTSLGWTFVVCTNGTGYFYGSYPESQWSEFLPAPVPLADVADWTPWVLYTKTGAWWYRRSTIAQDLPWIQMGTSEMAPPVPPCFMPLKAEQAPMGKVKALFR